MIAPLLTRTKPPREASVVERDVERAWPGIAAGAVLFALAWIATARDAATNASDVLAIVALTGIGVAGIALALWRRQYRLRTALQRELNEKDRTLDWQRERLDAFVRLAGHDFQEPLRKMVSFGHLLDRHADGQLSPEAQRDLGYITDAAHRMTSLIQDLLTYSKTAGEEFNRRPVALGRTLESVLDAHYGPIHDSNAKIEHGELPTVSGHEAMLNRLWRNLISNALRFRRPDAIPEISIACRQHADSWRFSVRDNGIGIDPQFADHVFVPFRRAHGRSEYPGNGIGLCICREIVHRHGGTIWFEPNADAGTTFYFELPRTPDEERAA
jgi:light-regulated signal transduction histidine kinase (bacteriophytochrome)